MRKIKWKHKKPFISAVWRPFFLASFTPLICVCLLLMAFCLQGQAKTPKPRIVRQKVTETIASNVSSHQVSKASFRISSSSLSKSPQKSPHTQRLSLKRSIKQEHSKNSYRRDQKQLSLSPPQSDIDKTSHDCIALTRYFEKKYQMPKGLLLAIATVESRCRPWAVNLKIRKSLYCKSLDEAVDYVSSLKGTKNISIGYMQINWGVHKKAFVNDLRVAFTPYYNVKFAAKLLARLYQKHGSWKTAVLWYNPIRKKANYAYWEKVRKLLSNTNNQNDEKPTTKQTNNL